MATASLFPNWFSYSHRVGFFVFLNFFTCALESVFLPLPTGHHRGVTLTFPRGLFGGYITDMPRFPEVARLDGDAGRLGGESLARLCTPSPTPVVSPLNKSPFLFLQKLSREMFYTPVSPSVIYVPFTNLSLGFCSVYKRGAIFLPQSRLPPHSGGTLRFPADDLKGYNTRRLDLF